MSHRVFIGLGSNIRCRLDYLRAAVVGLRGLPRTRLARLSPVYETSPVGPRQKNFANAVAEIQTGLGPTDLLRHLKALEKSLGRRPRGRWGPREIDLDILIFGRQIRRGKILTVPHPRLQERKFALKPLADIAPDFRDPVTGLKIRRLLAQLTAPDQRVRLYRKNLFSPQ